MDPDVQKLQIDAHNKEVAAADAKAKAYALAAQKMKAKPGATEAGEEAGEELSAGTKVRFSNEGGRETLEGEVIPYSSDLEDLDTGGAVSDYHIEGGILIRTDDGEIHHRQVDDVDVLSGSEDAESKLKPHPLTCNKPNCPKCTLEGREKDEERLRKGGYYGKTNNESSQITNFIKALSQKNYAAANKYLQGVVESKLKRSISDAYNK